MELHIVIPVYNEKDNIGKTLDEIKDKVKSPYDVLIVYDFDEDNTLPALKEYGQRNQEMKIQLVKNDYGKGVVNAIKKGLHQVQSGAALVVMADFSDDFRVVDDMVKKMEEGSDIVCGSRYMRGGKQTGGPWLKGQLSRIAGLSLHLFTGINTHDISNSFKMYSADLLRSIQLESTGGFEVGLEILVKAFTLGRKITEVPSEWRERTAGESRFRLWQWIPHYLKWYFFALKYRWTGKK